MARETAAMPPAVKGSLTSIQMVHTLAQNNLSEFCCGMHLTCKNNPVKPDRSGSVTCPEKHRNGSLLTDCENRTGSELTWNGT